MVPYSNYKRIPAEEMLFWKTQWHWNTHRYQSACLTNRSDLFAYSESQSIRTTVSSEGNRATVDAQWMPGPSSPCVLQEPVYSFDRWRHHFSALVSKEIMYKVWVHISRYIYKDAYYICWQKEKYILNLKIKKNLKTIVLDKVCKVLCSASMGACVYPHRTYAYKTTGGSSDMCL